MRLRTLSVIVAGSLVVTASHVDAQNLFKVPELVPSSPGSRLQAQPLGPARPRQNESLFLRSPTPRFQFQLSCGRVVPATPDIDPKFLKGAPDDKKYTMRSVPAPPCVPPNATALPSVAPRAPR